MKSAWSDITRLPPTHFLDIERSGTGSLCETDGGVASGDPTTALVERVTCRNCQDAINRRLANARNRDVLNRKRERRKAASLGKKSQTLG